VFTLKRTQSSVLASNYASFALILVIHFSLIIPKEDRVIPVPFYRVTVGVCVCFLVNIFVSY